MKIGTQLYSITIGLFIIFTLIIGGFTSQSVENAIIDEAISQRISLAYEIKDSIGAIDENTTQLKLLLQEINDNTPYVEYIYCINQSSVVYSSLNGEVPEISKEVRNTAIPYYESIYNEKHICVIYFPTTLNSKEIIYMGFSMEDAYLSVNETKTKIYVALSVIGIIFILMIHFLNRSLLRPVYQLTETSSKIARGYDTEKIPLCSTDEMNMLINSFNEMVEIRNNDKHRLEKLNEELIERNKYLENLARDLYHDTQTPLTTIGGYVSILDDAIKTNDDKIVNDSIEVIKKAAATLSDSYKFMGNKIRDELEGENKKRK